MNPKNDTESSPVQVQAPNNIAQQQQQQHYDDDMMRSSHDSFSACLLVMDENYRLSEWIAYHYYVLPLRYLVVTVDPQSRTSPSKILDQWRSRMTIVEWTDSNFTTENLLRREDESHDSKRQKHMRRQNTFYKMCAWHMHNHNRSWTAFHDTDEFLTMNSDIVKNVTMPSGYILDRIKQYGSNHSVQNPSWAKMYNRTCVVIPRTLYGAVESTEEERSKDVPSFVDPMQFDTLRWRYRASKRGERNGLGKSIVDVSKIEKATLRQKVSAHRVFVKSCPGAFIDYKDSPLGLHHYLGSWEAYSYREDARKGGLRSYDVWLQRSIVQSGGPDDIIRPWIQGFVDLVGEEAARELLKDAGIPKDYQMDQNTTLAWKAKPLAVLQGKQKE
jgi:hypothetical protein